MVFPLKVLNAWKTELESLQTGLYALLEEVITLGIKTIAKTVKPLSDTSSLTLALDPNRLFSPQASGAEKKESDEKTLPEPSKTSAGVSEQLRYQD